MSDLHDLVSPPATAGGARLRPIEESDWPAIAWLEAAAYDPHGLTEGPQALRSRAYPDTSFVLDDDGRIGGYLLALPYPRGSSPDLRRPEGPAHRSANLHLHDIVIDPGLRGCGWGRRLVSHLTAIARSRAYQRISLVSVGGTTGFWAACGFHPHRETELPVSYGPGAVYMSRVLG
ncbi:GNAT family N-acetyltransferase [Actinoplanes sp. NPDC026670]|uniref:GNAT family N-acetyltransferase n=1 Tax=Actinoplanes sp. NPDC026670 TaxID=3154700 RepID=UPI00340F424F